MNEKILIVGQFPEPVTGEAVVNAELKAELETRGCQVKTVNSSIIKSAANVGMLSPVKVYRALLFMVQALFGVAATPNVYITPGQSFWGLLRFAPIVLLCILLRRNCTLHWHGYGFLESFKQAGILRFIFFCGRIKNIFLTEDLVEKLHRDKLLLRKSQIKVIKNFSTMPVTSGGKDCYEKPLRVLFLSSLTFSKGAHEFFQASQRLPDVQFDVCGSGDRVLEDEAAKRSVSQKNFEYHGVVSGERKIDMYHQAHVFVLQSNYKTEGAPLTLIEAMSNGCGVVTTKNNGIPETVGNAGIFIDAACVDSLVTAIRTLDEDRVLLKKYSQMSISKARGYSKARFMDEVCASIFSR